MEGWWPKDEPSPWIRPWTIHQNRNPGHQIKTMENYGPWHNTYLAIYFTLTGLHALHVIAGCIVIFAIWGPLAKVWEQDPERYINRVEVSGLFWHFVDLVWIFLFPCPLSIMSDHTSPLKALHVDDTPSKKCATISGAI
jgi:hypothetical protein